MFNLDPVKMMNEAYEALRKTKQYKEETQRDILQETQEFIKKSDFGKDLYEPYDQKCFETKLRIDMLYYDRLLDKLNEEQSEKVSSAVGKLYKTIREIYEFVNIKPEVFGKQITENILTESENTIDRKLSKEIYEFLDYTFYRHTPEKRMELYFDKCRETSKQLIKEGVDPKEAIEYSIKVAVAQNLLENIAFPKLLLNRVRHLCESEDFGKIFEQGELIELVEKFDEQIYNLSKVVAACV